MISDMDYSGEREVIDALAKNLKIDIQKIIKAIEATLHRCEVCGCSEITACAGGCSWDKKFLGAIRYVCSNCPDKAKPIATAKPSSKTKKSAAA